MAIEVVNFGCRLNSYEGEVIRAQAQAAGLEHAIIFNSCAVTAEAERQVRQSIRRARQADPAARIIVTGCGAQIAPEAYARMPEVDAVLGNEEKLHAANYEVCRTPPVSMPAPDEATVLVNDILSITETAGHMVESFDGRARAFVQIQNGCNHRCTFCIIPMGRGNSRSVPAGAVVHHVRALVARGYCEVVLTGVDISDYGKDLPGAPTLGSLIARVLTHVPELPRLRLSSIDAAEVDTQTEALFASEPRLMPHVHLSVQAGDDLVLKRMKRRHTRADIVAFTTRLRAARPDVVFGADLIAGFPTETDAMFDNTLRLIEEAGLTYLHVFPYSSRTGTPAARMPQVPRGVRKERAARLRAEGARQLQGYLRSRVGHTEQLVMERPTHGRSAGFAMVKLQTPQVVGTLVEVKVNGVEDQTLLAM